MTEKRPLGLPSARLVMIAAIAGIAAGAVAVYVKQAGYGNAGAVASGNSSGQCEGAVRKAASLSAFAKGEVAAMVAASNPRKLDTLSFKGPSGQDLKMTDFSGKTVLVNLWATWCGPCREEMPALDTLQKEMGGDRFEVVAINIDSGDDTRPKAFLSDTGVTGLGYYRDASMGVFNALKKEGLAFGLPVTLLVDGNGCLLQAMNGPAAWDSDDARTLISQAIQPSL